MKHECVNLIILSILSVLLLSCSHENPIDKNALSTSGKFLYQSSLYAEKQLNADENHGGSDYGSCVEGKYTFPSFYCEKLYEAMISYAKSQNKAYQDLTIEDLMDANAYYQVKGYYDNQVFLNNT